MLNHGLGNAESTSAGPPKLTMQCIYNPRVQGPHHLPPNKGTVSGRRRGPELERAAERRGHSAGNALQGRSLSVGFELMPATGVGAERSVSSPSLGILQPLIKHDEDTKPDARLTLD